MNRPAWCNFGAFKVQLYSSPCVGLFVEVLERPDSFQKHQDLIKQRRAFYFKSLKEYKIFINALVRSVVEFEKAS